MSIRLFVDRPLQVGLEMNLPPGAARHAQVRRVQPGDALTLFDGLGRDWPSEVLAMGRQDVSVRVGAPIEVARELAFPVTIAIGMPANDRMDDLVEKATELGVHAIQPLMCERSVLRLSGERAAKKQAHWQAIAQAASEQCGRARVPDVADVMTLPAWLATVDRAAARLLLSPTADATALSMSGAFAAGVVTLSGPEGGLAPMEIEAAMAHGFVGTRLGPRVLRADTAPLAALAFIGLSQ